VKPPPWSGVVETHQGISIYKRLFMQYQQFD